MTLAPLPAEPVAKGIVDLLAAARPAAFGHLPTDGRAVALALPVFVLDSVVPQYNGPPFGDLHGQADWTCTARAIAERKDQAYIWAGRALALVLDRRDDGQYVHEIQVDGQWVTGRDVAPAPIQDGPSGDGIVAVVLRFIIRTQRA